MKNQVLYLTGFIVLIAACTSTGGAKGFVYYDAQEVIEAWEEAMLDEDVEQYAATFWPDAKKTHIPREGEPIELIGREAIGERQAEYNRRYDFAEYEIPDYDMNEDTFRGRAVVVYHHEDIGLVETLIISRRDDLWGIEEQLIEPDGPRVASAAAVATETKVKIAGKRIAVVGIDSITTSVDDETVRGMLLFVENEFVNIGQVKVVDRKSIEKIIDEYNFQSTGLTNEETAAEIGKLAGAEIIVAGSLSAVGSIYYLQLRLIDVETAEVVASSLGEARSEEGFLAMTAAAVERLF